MGERYYGRRRAYGAFKADIEDFVQQSEKRMAALMKKSIADVFENAQTPTAKGGRMRVDTGFLRASGRMSLNGMPSGPTRGDLKEPGSYSYDPATVIVTLGSLKIGQTVYVGWTANYAKYRELFDGFMEGALQHWSRIVAINTDIMRQRIK